MLGSQRAHSGEGFSGLARATQVLEQNAAEGERGERGATALRAVWSAIPEPSASRPQAWHRYVGCLLGYTQPSGPVDKAGAEFKVIATNPLSEVCMATPAISEGAMYYRTQDHLVAVGKK